MNVDVGDVLIFLVVFAAAASVLQAVLRKPPRRPEDEPVASTTADGPLWDARDVGLVLRFLASLVPQRASEARRLELELGQAGYYRRSAPTVFLALRNTGLVAVIIVGGFLTYGAIDADRIDLAMQIGLGALAAAVLIFGVPRLIVQAISKARLQRIQKALPDTLDIFSMCMVGGLSFPEALARVSRAIGDTQPDLAQELRIVQEQMKLGSFEQAFRLLAARLELPELKSLASLVMQAERLGTHLVAPIETFSSELRRDRRRTADGRASSAAARMTLPMVFCLLPATILLLWGPAVVEIRDFLRDQQGPLNELVSPDEIARQPIPDELKAKPD